MDYLARRLEPVVRDTFESHVDTCNDCRELLAEVAHAPTLHELAALDPSREPRHDDSPILELASLEGERYAVGEMLGRGGMGEVRLARDSRIPRDVAVKVMRAGSDDPATLARFVREARVQGVLEHPAVLPVYDLGLDRDGRPYFVMKRLAGTTLEQMLAGSSIERTRRALLTKLVDVCLAIEFAHTRGVVHRDLKPANLMLGDFGEAYVLDWGLAKVTGEATPVVLPDGRELGVDTQSGQILGTPGYIPPEQVRGEEVDARADVFALGCILFEILAGAPALPRGQAAIAATLAASHHRPRDRAPDAMIPAELDDLCARATAADPSVRPTARELASGIQAYLEGDRDLARRRELAELHAQLAVAAMLAHDDAGRATAMREAGRAIAVDPDNATAQALLGRLLLEAPTRMPEEALEALNLARSHTRRGVIWWISWVYLVIGLATPLFFVFPTHHPSGIIALTALNTLMALICAVLGRRFVPLRSPWYFVLVVINALILATGCLMFGPLLLMPVFVLSSLCGWLILPTGYPAWHTIVSHVLATVPFVVLESVGVLPSTFAFDGRSLVLTPPAIDLTAAPAGLMLAITFTTQFVNMAFIMVSSRRGQDALQDRAHSHTWHLEQLLPKR